jgi:hypothetical protein
MASKTAPKPIRSVGKSTTKSFGRDHGKNDKQSANLVEIVPGKFNEHDWFSLLENDETEDFIADIFEMVWGKVSKKVEEIYLERQVLPYTLMVTEEAWSHVIQVSALMSNIA